MEAQHDVWQHARKMWEGGLVVGSAGNVSRRVDAERIAITPSAVPYESMTAEQIVLVHLADGRAGRRWNGTCRDALPCPTRGGGSRGAAVASGRRATARRPHATDVTRRRWAGSGRTCPRATGAAERRASIAACSRVMGGLWTEQKSITRNHERLHSCRQTFRLDDIHVVPDDLSLPDSLREVIA